MNEQLKESISALADGEVDDLELRRLLKLMADQPEAADRLKEEWSRYHLIGEAVRGQGQSICSPDFLAGIASALQSEQETAGTDLPGAEAVANIGVAGAGITGASDSAASSESPSGSWSRFAIAASVAFVAILGVQQFQAGNSDDILVAQKAGSVESVQPVIPAGELQLVNAGQATAGSVANQLETAEAQKRLNEYLLQHASHAAQQSGQGGLTFARLASFEEEQ